MSTRATLTPSRMSFCDVWRGCRNSGRRKPTKPSSKRGATYLTASKNLTCRRYWNAYSTARRKQLQPRMPKRCGMTAKGEESADGARCPRLKRAKSRAGGSPSRSAGIIGAGKIARFLCTSQKNLGHRGEPKQCASRGTNQKGPVEADGHEKRVRAVARIREVTFHNHAARAQGGGWEQHRRPHHEV